MEDRTLSLSEVAGLMGVSERTVRRWIKAGKLRAYKPGRDYRIPESAVRALVEESEISPKAQRHSSLEPSFNDVLAEERRLRYLRAWRAFTHKLAARWEERPPGAPEEASVVLDAMQALIAEGAFERPPEEITTGSWREAADWLELQFLFRGIERLNRIAERVEMNAEAERRRRAFKEIQGRMAG